MKDILSNLYKLLKDSDDDLLKEIDLLSGSIYKNLLKIVEKLDVSKGKISKKNNTLFLEQITGLILSEDLLSKMKDFEGLFKVVQKDNEEVLSTIVGERYTFKDDLTKQFVQDNVKIFLGKQVVSANVSKEINKLFFNAVVLGSKREDLEEQLRNAVVEQKILTRYVKGATADTLNRFDGLVNDEARKRYKLDCFAYVGSVIPATRSHCREWASQDILKVSDLEKQLPTIKGNGFIEGTTVDTFAQNRGGYRCRHRAIPVRCVDAERLLKQLF